ncbi:MAG: single-stranded DNA-binding protein [Desulfurococcales archaeon ex4484_217_2]|nr:MAG: single-stranded DNA-binding protein [Desulfurococcales archaeon ex4484_217_2]
MGKEVKIKDLKPGMDNITVKVRVLEASKPKVIQTRKGSRVISEALVGDETGRTRMTLWGRKAGSIKAGEVIRLKKAFVTAFRGVAQLNIGKQGEIVRLDDSEVVASNKIPENSPKAETSRRPYKRMPFKKFGGKGGRRE